MSTHVFRLSLAQRRALTSSSPRLFIASPTTFTLVLSPAHFVFVVEARLRATLVFATDGSVVAANDEPSLPHLQFNINLSRPPVPAFTDIEHFAHYLTSSLIPSPCRAFNFTALNFTQVSPTLTNRCTSTSYSALAHHDYVCRPVGKKGSERIG